MASNCDSSTRDYLLGDHGLSEQNLGGTNVTVTAAGVEYGEVRYRAWGEQRYASGTTPTTYKFTGQREESYINLYWYSSRWYDPGLGRFVSPDPIVPGIGEGGNPGAVGYLGKYTYSALTVDYHETQFLVQLNAENQARQQNPGSKFAPDPTITIAFDRYSYSLNNPVGYVDPSGHFAVLAALAVITPIGWVAIGVGIGVTLALSNPEIREGAANELGSALESAANGINTLFARGDGGASQSAQHLAMLLGADVAGFSSHPGMPDPEGRDRKHNAEGLRNTLRDIQRNMRSGETIQDYLTRQGWGETEIQEYTSQVNNYVNNVMSTDVEYFGLGQDVADEIFNLATALGMQ